MTYRSTGASSSSDVLAGQIAETAFKHFSHAGTGARSTRGRLFLF